MCDATCRASVPTIYIYTYLSINPYLYKYLYLYVYVYSYMNIGTCECNDITPLSQICDATCRASVPTMRCDTEGNILLTEGGITTVVALRYACICFYSSIHVSLYVYRYKYVDICIHKFMFIYVCINLCYCSLTHV
jgi:hypothetical protein